MYRAAIATLVLLTASAAFADGGLVTLAGIVVAVRLQGQVFPGTPRGQLKKRLDELEEAGWVSEAVRKAIQAVEGGAAAAGAAGGAA